MKLLTHTKGIKTGSQQSMTAEDMEWATLHAEHEWAKENGEFDLMFKEMQEDVNGDFAALREAHQASVNDGTFDRMFAEMQAQ